MTVRDETRRKLSARAKARYADPAERLKTSRSVAQSWADLDPASREEWVLAIRAARNRRRAGRSA